jgi:excisionase family DNA binding protein
MSERPESGSPKADPRRATPARDILNIEEAAQLLGVSIKTFNKVLHGEDMPARKIGREWKFSRQALIDWVGNGRSRDYYREHNEQDGSAAARAAGRRTQGWRIELD